MYDHMEITQLTPTPKDVHVPLLGPCDSQVTWQRDFEGKTKVTDCNSGRFPCIIGRVPIWLQGRQGAVFSHSYRDKAEAEVRRVGAWKGLDPPLLKGRIMQGASGKDGDGLQEQSPYPPNPTPQPATADNQPGAGDRSPTSKN